VTTSDQFFCIDLKNPAKGWKELPRLPMPVSHSVLVFQSNHQQNCIYLLGGRKKNSNGISDFYSSVYAFDIKTNEWQEKKSMPYSLCAGTGISEGENKILMFGGDRSETFHRVEELIAEINNETEEIKKKQLILQKNKLQSMHPVLVEKS
jgi:N-acetylneuraminic acid mutarotase